MVVPVELGWSVDLPFLSIPNCEKGLLEPAAPVASGLRGSVAGFFCVVEAEEDADGDGEAAFGVCWFGLLFSSGLGDVDDDAPSFARRLARI